MRSNLTLSFLILCNMVVALVIQRASVMAQQSRLNKLDQETGASDALSWAKGESLSLLSSLCKPYIERITNANNPPSLSLSSSHPLLFQTTNKQMNKRNHSPDGQTNCLRVVHPYERQWWVEKDATSLFPLLPSNCSGDVPFNPSVYLASR